MKDGLKPALIYFLVRDLYNNKIYLTIHLKFLANFRSWLKMNTTSRNCLSMLALEDNFLWCTLTFFFNMIYFFDYFFLCCCKHTNYADCTHSVYLDIDFLQNKDG